MAKGTGNHKSDVVKAIKTAISAWRARAPLAVFFCEIS
jgi:hypothetical protein